MATISGIDDSLIQRATELGGHPTYEATVTAALMAYSGRLERRRIVELFGTIDYDPDYDYKQQRKRR